MNQNQTSDERVDIVLRLGMRCDGVCTVAREFRATDYDAMQVFQSLTEIQKDLSGLSADTRRAISDIAKLDGKVSQLSEALAWAKGFAVAAVILVTVCAGFAWWLKLANLS